MLGNNHLVVNTATTISVSTGLMALSQYSGDNQMLIGLSPLAHYTIDYVTMNSYNWHFILYMSVCLILFLLGAYLPDIDSPTSALGRYIPFPVQHRTWTHTIWVIVLLMVLSYFFRPLIWLTWGYFIHVFIDSFSRAGVCWFYPISKYRRYGNGAFVKEKHVFKIYRGGAPSEYVVMTLICVLAVFVVYVGLKSHVYDNVLSHVLQNINPYS